jgi:hypothetical protein
MVLNSSSKGAGDRTENGNDPCQAPRSETVTCVVAVSHVPIKYSTS